MRPSPSAPKHTRHALLGILKREGPQEARNLAGRLGITPMAISLQLGALEKEKLVTVREEAPAASRRGRPRQRWHLTDAANRVFPDAHALLTVGLLASLQEAYGPDGMRKLIDTRTRQQVEEYRPSLLASASLGRKVEALARIRDREGYMTEVSREEGGGFLLVENHCPICTAATACQGFCQSELRVFQDLLGPEVGVTRIEHILSGARRCAYSIQPSGKAAAKVTSKVLGNRPGGGTP